MSIQNTVHVKALGQKYDTEENWAKSNYVPIKGEIIIYSPNKIKIGDGITKVNNLPFIFSANSINNNEKTIVVYNQEGGFYRDPECTSLIFF